MGNAPMKLVCKLLKKKAERWERNLYILLKLKSLIFPAPVITLRQNYTDIQNDNIFASYLIRDNVNIAGAGHVFPTKYTENHFPYSIFL
ncbi:hypothetical protein C5O23_00335 [Duncaniella muris]|uniref:Uncharacterized protein n=1 Tax=Duncaniella muris TaxID=2094150 RepID=A0A2V1ITP7_9BACT|nr:hypothetical protein C5O23_00335 [Duncaniella muris]